MQDRDCRKAAWPVWLLKTLPPNGPFVPNNFFRPRTICKVAIIKTTSAILLFFFSSFLPPCFFLFSFPFPSLVWFWILSKQTCLLTPFHSKLRQISLGLFSKIASWTYIEKITYCNIYVISILCHPLNIFPQDFRFFVNWSLKEP